MADAHQQKGVMRNVRAGSLVFQAIAGFWAGSVREPLAGLMVRHASADPVCSNLFFLFARS
ncbi:MAG: hypothetical protein LAN61_05605 [Acidobacteriia bacterium]|nr:hypothetical protein [Terriglobia bacterium]